ncbi:unnamed protein product [Gongylonema pulchrum]|uniref:Uncharacterized protein n=1 Tax=Gongylonema pulchrum TaxID=637853 RepID=A0A3P6QKD7_9BILA|nr:unnamed protein product [Gongylonema pulchrum]
MTYTVEPVSTFFGETPLYFSDEQTATKVEIIKIHSEYESGDTKGPAEQQSAKTTSTAETEGNDERTEWKNDKGVSSSASTTTSSTKAGNVTSQHLENVPNGRSSETEQEPQRVVGEATSEHEQKALQHQAEHAARTIQRSWREFKTRGQSDQEEASSATAPDNEDQPSDTGAADAHLKHNLVTVNPEVNSGSRSEGKNGKGRETPEEATNDSETRHSVKTNRSENGENRLEETGEMDRLGEKISAQDSESVESFSLMEGYAGRHRINRKKSDSLKKSSQLRGMLVVGAGFSSPRNGRLLMREEDPARKVEFEVF